MLTAKIRPMTHPDRSLPIIPSVPRTAWVALLLIWLLSLIPKLLGAHNMVWEIDMVPVVMRGSDWLAGGPFPAFGTLSSVAAYNMPMLVWLNLPMLIVTGNPFWAMLLTGILWNALSTWAVFRLGTDLFGLRTGLAAAALFAFHETSIAGTYTAWAQLFLPGFFAMTLLCLWRWIATERGFYLALSGIIATAAFMTHFGAVLLYPAMLVIALLVRARWQWRGLLIGAAVVMVMLAPYLLFEADRDFADVRAFFAKEPLVGQQSLDDAAYLKPESGPIAPPYDGPASAEASGPDTSSPKRASEVIEQASAPVSRSTAERALDFLVSVPEQIRIAFWLAFQGQAPGWGSLSGIAIAINHAVSAIFVGGSLWAIGRYLWLLKKRGLRQFSVILIERWAGRVLILLIFLLVIAAGFIATRTPPWEQPTYYPGFISIQLIIVAATLDAFFSRLMTSNRTQNMALIIAVALAASVGGMDRIGRIMTYDDSVHTPLNGWLYRHVEAAVDYIAEDWQGGNSLVISYDLMPEMRNYWWIIPWSRTDPAYTMGLPYDYLLDYLHGLTNTNTNPIGWADDADYIVVWEPGLERHDLSQYDVAQFGTIYVLKPKQ
ncbi:MAG: glycosyltransferase family 39 protein [Anaerolineae bacterium]|nr:glycosyltransferase family 39 protein [Anaerolineae bacterium]